MRARSFWPLPRCVGHRQPPGQMLRHLTAVDPALGWHLQIKDEGVTKTLGVGHVARGAHEITELTIGNGRSRDQERLERDSAYRSFPISCNRVGEGIAHREGAGAKLHEVRQRAPGSTTGSGDLRR